VIGFQCFMLHKILVFRYFLTGVVETGDWRLETGDWRLETGDWRLALISERGGTEKGIVLTGQVEG